MIENYARFHTATGRHAQTTAHPGFAKRLPGGDGMAGFIAAEKCGEAFKAVAEIGGRSGNGKDGGSRPEGAARQRPRDPQESACPR